MPDTLKMEFDSPTPDSAYELGIVLLRTLHEVLSGPRHGRWYPVPGNIAYDRSTSKKLRAKNYYVKFTGTNNRSEIRGAAYRASAPGEPPAVRTGRLRQSFHMMVFQVKEYLWRTVIKTNVLYADDLEYGTEKVDPRPFMSVAIARAMPEIIRLIGKGQIKVLRNTP
ncbi:MAG: hypothetical protein ACFFD1_02000 [Candidatus Thorarchaeota archaeon]